ncbi:MAG TPA: EAL domain-containing protein [Candidatus Udaeobacter sp.]|nr:EAL domain-containing protein [Candidatus Udaeobacter sp.]
MNEGMDAGWVATELAKAIGGKGLSVAYQPKIELNAGAFAGVEALVRWRHPEEGCIGPALFIPLAEQSAVIDALTLWMADQVLGQAAAWRDQGQQVPVAINVSARNLNQVEFPDLLAETCRRHRIPPGNVIVEITETASQQIVKLLDTLTRVRLKGFKLSLDDFGVGFSSLAQLQQLPFSEVKVDRIFVKRLVEEKDSRIITRAIINLAHELGLKVVAEGVESAAALQILVDFGCDVAQGYFIARPLPGSEMLELLGSHWATLQSQIVWSSTPLLQG